MVVFIFFCFIPETPFLVNEGKGSATFYPIGTREHILVTVLDFSSYETIPVYLFLYYYQQCMLFIYSFIHLFIHLFYVFVYFLTFL